MSTIADRDHTFLIFTYYLPLCPLLAFVFQSSSIFVDPPQSRLFYIRAYRCLNGGGIETGNGLVVLSNTVYRQHVTSRVSLKLSSSQVQYIDLHRICVYPLLSSILYTLSIATSAPLFCDHMHMYTCNKHNKRSLHTCTYTNDIIF